MLVLPHEAASFVALWSSGSAVLLGREIPPARARRFHHPFAYLLDMSHFRSPKPAFPIFSAGSISLYSTLCCQIHPILSQAGALAKSQSGGGALRWFFCSS